MAHIPWVRRREELSLVESRANTQILTVLVDRLGLEISKLLQFENNKKSLHLILTKPEAVDIWDSDLSAQLTVFFFVKRNLPENVHINYAAGKQRIEQQHHVEQQLVEQQHVDLVEQQQDVVEVLLRVFLESNLTEKMSVRTESWMINSATVGSKSFLFLHSNNHLKCKKSRKKKTGKKRKRETKAATKFPLSVPPPIT